MGGSTEDYRELKQFLSLKLSSLEEKIKHKEKKEIMAATDFVLTHDWPEKPYSHSHPHRTQLETGRS